MSENKAKLACELVPHDDEHTGVKIHIEGSTPALMEACEQITTHLMESFIEKYGKTVAMGMYAAIQMNMLKSLGIDPEEEVKESKERLKKLERIDALKDILGKTFEMPTKDGEAE